MSDETRRAIEEREAAKRPDPEPEPEPKRHRRRVVSDVEPVALEDIPVSGEVE